MDLDLQLAASVGLLVVAEEGCPGGAQVSGPFLEYDPTIPKAQRFRLVVGAVTEALRKKIITTSIRH